MCPDLHEKRSGTSKRELQEYLRNLISQKFLVVPLTGGQFLSWRPTFLARNFTCAPDRAGKERGAQNQSARSTETQQET